MNSQDIIQQNKETYDNIAEPFSQTRKFLWDDLKPLVKYTRDNDKVLDLGCGTGRLYQLFEKKQVNYVGVDNSEGQLVMAKKQYPEGLFKLAEMTELPFPDAEFDIIYCIAAFHHLPDKDARIKSLQEMKRILKPGGLVVMTNWNLLGDWGKEKVESEKYTVKNGNDFFVPYKNSDRKILGERFYYGFTLEELNDLFVETGFKVEENYYSGKISPADIKSGRNIVSVVRS